MENEHALRQLAPHLQALDTLSTDERNLRLVKGLMAGNVFDWGAKEVAALMERQDLGFSEAMSRLQGAHPIE